MAERDLSRERAIAEAERASTGLKRWKPPAYEAPFPRRSTGSRISQEWVRIEEKHRTELDRQLGGSENLPDLAKEFDSDSGV